MGLAPEELRRRNFIHEGQTLAVNQIIREKVDLDLLLDRAFELSGYHAKRQRFQEESRDAVTKKGIGFATFLHGPGFTASPPHYPPSQPPIEPPPHSHVP